MYSKVVRKAVEEKRHLISNYAQTREPGACKVATLHVQKKVLMKQSIQVLEKSSQREKTSALELCNHRCFQNCFRLLLSRLPKPAPIVFDKQVWKKNKGSKSWNEELFCFDWTKDVKALGTNKARIFLRDNIKEWLRLKNWGIFGSNNYFNSSFSK